MAKPVAEWLRHYRRLITIPFVIAAFLVARYQREWIWLSIALVASGELLRLWSAGYLYKNRMLATSGPYRWIRNPLYAGSFLIATGFSVVAGSLWVWVLTVCYFVFCYLPVIRYEERLLSQKFGDEYPMYSAKVPAIYPTMRPYPGAGNQRFTWSQVVANKEYNAVLGIVAAYVVLILLRS